MLHVLFVSPMKGVDDQYVVYDVIVVIPGKYCMSIGG